VAGTYWSRLGTGLGSLGFNAFGLKNLQGSDLVALETAVATAKSSFTTTTEKPEWQVIAKQLRRLDTSASFLALRTDGPNLEFVLGRDGVAGIDEVASYTRFVADVLATIAKATHEFSVSPELSQAIGTAANSVDPRLKTAADLVLPLLRFQGEFRCVVLHAVGAINSNLESQWTARWLVEWRPPIIGVRQCVVSPWLWAVNQGKITRAQGDGAHLRMANFSPESMLRALTYG
jgi:hypothetical protein